MAVPIKHGAQCSGADVLVKCSFCKGEHILAQQAALAAAARRRAEQATLDGMLLASRQYFGGISAHHALELTFSIARDAVGLGPYAQRLAQRPTDVEVATIRDAEGTPRPYETDLARRRAQNGRRRG